MASIRPSNTSAEVLRSWIGWTTDRSRGLCYKLVTVTLLRVDVEPETTFEQCEGLRKLGQWTFFSVPRRG